MSPSRGYTRRNSGHNPSYGYGNAYGNNYGNSYAGYGYSDGYPEYEHHQYSQEQQYQPEQYRTEQYHYLQQQQPEQYQTEQYQYQHQQYHQQYPQQYSQYHDAFAYDTYNEYVPQRRPSPSYDAYDDGSAARRRPFAQSSGGYSTYSTSSPPSSSPSYSRRPPPPRSQPSTEPFLMPTLSTFNEQRASRAISHSPRRPSRSPPPPRRTEPREEYLRISLEPSWHVDAPETARKLIVLDLNGSLLVRSAHQKRPPLPRHGHGNHNSQSQETSSTDPYADPTAFRPVRTVYPRPYLSSFVEYILHPTTKKWLDTVVWSSAQPHSVDDMVGRCFKERREELRAVWARNTLGLTGDEYHKKSLTLKDLEKPWTELPIIPSSGSETSSSPPASCSLPSSPPASDSAATSDPTTMPSSSNTNPTAPSDTPHLPSNLHLKSSSYANHSERTTLLIDDSPLKAALQPWNHLVIREYVQELRNKDLKVAELERTRAEKEKDASVSKTEGEDTVVGQSERLGDKNEFAGVDVGITAAAAQNVVETEATSLAEPSIIPVPFDSTSKDVPIDITSAADDAQARKLKRLQKKEAGKLKRAEEHAKRIAEEVGEQVYDQTLLAVIGILDRMRWEGNVAGWLRAGGLMDVEGVDVNVTEGVASEIVEAEGVESKNGSERTEEMAGRALTLTHTPPTRSRDASLSPGPSSLPGDNSSSKKRRRVSDENENVDVDGAKSAKTNIGMDTSADAARSFSDGEKSIDTTIDGVQSAHALAPEAEIEKAPKEDLEKEKEEQASTGVPSISEAISADALPNMTVAPTPTVTETPKLWYEHPDILSFWAERGRKALAELGIEVQSDMVVNGGSNGKAG